MALPGKGDYLLVSRWIVSCITQTEGCRDDRVADYLPGLSDYWDDMTIYDLATHMSGLGRDWPPGIVSDWPISAEGGGPPPYNGHDFPTVEELVQSISDNEAVAPPWTEPTYSNSGTGLLGIVLVKAAQRHFGSQAPRSFAALAHKMVFEPLSMSSSHFLVAESNKERIVVPSFMPDVTVSVYSLLSRENKLTGRHLNRTKTLLTP